MCYSVRMGIGNKNLTEIMITHQLHQVLNPLIVNLIKNIIEQQNRNSAGVIQQMATRSSAAIC